MTYSQKRKLKIAAGWVGYFAIGLITAAVNKHYLGFDCQDNHEAALIIGIAFFVWPMVWLFAILGGIGLILCAIL